MASDRTACGRRTPPGGQGMFAPANFLRGAKVEATCCSGAAVESMSSELRSWPSPEEDASELNGCPSSGMSTARGTPDPAASGVSFGWSAGAVALTRMVTVASNHTGGLERPDGQRLLPARRLCLGARSLSPGANRAVASVMEQPGLASERHADAAAVQARDRRDYERARERYLELRSLPGQHAPRNRGLVTGCGVARPA